MAVTIRMLGAMAAAVDRRGGRQDAVRIDRRERALLGFLLVHRGRPRARAQIVEALWPEKPARLGPHCLSTALWRLRNTLASLPGVALEAPRGGGIRIALADTILVDMLRFEQLVEPIVRPSAPRRGAILAEAEMRDLQAAIALYGGELLPGIDADWVDHDRQRLQDDYLQCLALLAAHFEHRADYGHARKFYSEILRLDPAREDIHRRLMVVHWMQGRRARAVRQYESCVATLREELGVAVAGETRRLAESIARAPDAASLAPPPGRPASPEPEIQHLHARLVTLLDQLNEVSSASARLLEKLAAERAAAPEYAELSLE